MTDEYISNKALFDLIEKRHSEMIAALAKHEENEMDEVQEIKRDVKDLQHFKWRATGILSLALVAAPFLGVVLNQYIGG
jgi:hypothetical protein